MDEVAGCDWARWIKVWSSRMRSNGAAIFWLDCLVFLNY